MHSSIVIVDDSMISLAIAEKLITESGFFHEVHTFSNPERALQHLLEHPADILMSDIEMPHMDGFELMGRISGRTLKIACTTNGDYVSRARETGCQGFLLKPFNSDKVYGTLARVSMLSAFSKSANIPVHTGTRMSA